MYSYIYDEFLDQSKYNKTLYKIEKRLTDLGINGKTVRLGISKKLEDAVHDQIRAGIKTIVAIGNNETVCRVMNVVAQAENNDSLTLGIIPLDEKDLYLADMLGIKNIEDACNILLGRRVEFFNLAKINKNYFLFNVEIKNPKTILEIDKDYAIKNNEPAEIIITNSPKEKKEKLDLQIKTKNDESFFPFSDLLIVNGDAHAIADKSFEIKTPARIKPCDKKIKIIVGKGRKI